MTFDECVRWLPDGVQAEWVDGEVTVLAPTMRHGRLVRLLLGMLSTYLAMTKLGEVFVAPVLMRALPDGPGRAPDLVVLLSNHLYRYRRAVIEGPVDLAIELVSSDSVTTDRVTKHAEYAPSGVPEYVVLDARDGRHDVAFYRRSANGTYAEVIPDEEGRYHSAVLPGFWLDPRWFTQ